MGSKSPGVVTTVPPTMKLPICLRTTGPSAKALEPQPAAINNPSTTEVFDLGIAVFLFRREDSASLKSVNMVHS
jgi:hypothetical protein